MELRRREACSFCLLPVRALLTPDAPGRRAESIEGGGQHEQLPAGAGAGPESCAWSCRVPPAPAGADPRLLPLPERVDAHVHAFLSSPCALSSLLFEQFHWPWRWGTAPEGGPEPPSGLCRLPCVSELPVNCALTGVQRALQCLLSACHGPHVGTVHPAAMLAVWTEQPGVGS